MSKIRISNFGPIGDGFLGDDGWLDISKVTVFIGNQGSGKSTVAKLLSTLTWIEKALEREDFKEKDVTPARFKKHCSYQNIGEYFKESTAIEYIGDSCSITYKNGRVSIVKNVEKKYFFPKIMYIPSERNFVGSVRNLRYLKGLPSTLYTFTDEFINAVEELKGQLMLPINDVRYEYQKLNKLSWIVGRDYKIKLSEASSGFQSFVPLFIVTKYLAESLSKKEDNTIRERSIEEEKRIRNEVSQILSNPDISDEIKQAALSVLSSEIRYSAFINIVEEPEQNLFPQSQQKILNSLLSFNNMNEGNKLIITTHSPYLINYLTLAVKAYKVCLSSKVANVRSKVAEIVPETSLLNPTDLTIFEMDEKKGTISKLADYKGVPSDENYLNTSLLKANQLFTTLQEIEKGWL